MSKYRYIGIDPGANGGIAVIDDRGRLEYHAKMPPLHECAKLFRSYAKHANSSIVYIEKVHAMPGDGVVSMFSFGQNYGQMLGILAAFDFTYLDITPKTWQKLYLIGFEADNFDENGVAKNAAKKKRDRKHALKAAAQALFPAVKVHLYIADAILLAHYAYQSRPKG